MKRMRLVIKLICSILIISLAVVSFVGSDPIKLAEHAASFSVAFVSPDGVFGFFNDDTSDEIDKTYESEQTVTDSVQNAAKPQTNQVLSQAIEEKRLGNIIKKTLSPYNANTHYDSVYINNQSGARIDISSDLASPLDFEVIKDKQPQILIYHTHATESFMSDESEYYTDHDEPRSTDTETNIVKIGEVIAERLTKAGYAVIHDKTLHDHPGYNGSYSRSEQTVLEALKKYPSVKIAIDVHRDSISSGKSDKVAPVVTVDGKEAAQVMLVMGSETGNVEQYPEWRQNLKLATKLQYVFEARYPQFARAMLLRSSRYNQHLTTGSILIEIGSDANTLSQALYSAQLVGDSLSVLLETQ